jgi:hypothetical protein
MRYVICSLQYIFEQLLVCDEIINLKYWLFWHWDVLVENIINYKVVDCIMVYNFYMNVIFIQCHMNVYIFLCCSSKCISFGQNQVFLFSKSCTHLIQ